jgi:thiol-disulfide isomerase/thioredoxin
MMLEPAARVFAGTCRALLLAAALAASALPAGAAAPDESAPVQVQLDAGRQALGRHDYRAALEAYKQADRLAAGHSAAALDGLATAYEMSGRLGDCIKAARRGVEEASTPAMRARLENHLGLALYYKFQSDHDQRELAEAVANLRQALDHSGGQANVVRYNLGSALLAQSRDEEGVAVLRDFLERQPVGAEAERARQLIADPRRAREAFAPDFSVVTLDGQNLSLDDLKGKVVLIDFWATWCGPCRESTPALKRLAEKGKQEPFVLFGISADRDGAKLRDYLAHEALGWPQYWDQAGNLERLFGVMAFPTFVVLDGEGRIVYTQRGWSSGRERELKSAISRAVDQIKSSGHAKTGKS